VRSSQRALAKLTLSLRVTGVRADGYHLLDSEMVTVSLADHLEFSAGDGLELIGGGETAGAMATDDTNLIRRALRAVGRRAHVRVHKYIPLGGGLGGGSADAAAVLRWSGVSDLALAVSLGGDVPFCLVGGRARVGGVGEVIDALPFEQRTFTLVCPPLSVSTIAVYRAWDDLGGPVGAGGNDLEPAALAVEPRLAQWRDRLGTLTGQSPRLAGSGATWFVEGAFEGPGLITVVTERPGWFSGASGM
jgi:4-diphosphocytidyl-2-C-methyl-D-erythritol kinase